jgi:hypothetical protein
MSPFSFEPEGRIDVWGNFVDEWTGARVCDRRKGNCGGATFAEGLSGASGDLLAPDEAPGAELACGV